jgi:uncharacterized protein
MLGDEVRALRTRYESRGHGHLFHNLMLFSRVLREMGLDASPSRTIDLARSIEFIGIGSKDDFKSAARAIMVRRYEEEPIFDYVFQMFWRKWYIPGDDNKPLREMPEGVWNDKSPVPTVQQQKPAEPERTDDVQQKQDTGQEGEKQVVKKLAEDTGREAEGDDSDAEKQRTYSASEVLQTKDFQDFDQEELQEARRLMADLRWSLPYHKSRRLQAARHGRRLDARRVIRRSLKYGGVPLQLSWRDRKLKPRPLVLICDISGSMDLYSRLLLQFMHSMESGLKYVETFVFGTRLTRITHELKNRNVDEALLAVSKIVKDWSGGKIGESLETFNLKWARRVMGHGAIVIVISDGWDRGNVETLRREMARLQRLSYRLIWLNPLLGLPDYQPLTVGIQAALDYVDDFLPAHNFRSLHQLSELLTSLQNAQRPDRKQQKRI